MPAFVIEYYDARGKTVAKIDANAANEADACDKHGHRKARQYPDAIGLMVHEVQHNGSLKYCLTEGIR